MRLRLFTAILTLITLFCQPALAAVTLSVSCPGQSLSSAIDTSTDPVITINLTGICTENVRVPEGYIVTINGGAIVQATSDTPTVRTLGRLTMNGVSVSSTLSSPFTSMVVAGKNSFLRVKSSTFTASTMVSAIAAWEASVLEFVDSTASGGREEAVLVMEGAHLYIGATVGNTVSISNTGLAAIGCYQANMLIHAEPSATINIGPAAVGLSTRGCAASVGSIVELKSPGTIRFTGISDSAVRAKSGDSISLTGVRIVNNSTATGVEVTAGSVEIDNATITGNRLGLSANRNGTVVFNNFFGTSTVNNVTPSTSRNFACYQNGQIYANANIVKSNGSTNVAATQCFIIGGTVRN